MNNVLKKLKKQSLSTNPFLSPPLFFRKILEYGFYLLFVVTPFILTTTNYELFEFPKMLFVYAMTGIIFGLWLAQAVVSGHFQIRRSFFLWPLVFFVVAQILSPLVSVDGYTSIWGYYSRFHGGLASTVCYAILFVVFTSIAYKKIVRNSLIALLATASFISLYALAEHFGIDAQYWVQDVQNRVFSTLGQPNWLAAWVVALLPITWWLTVKVPRRPWPIIILLSQLMTIF